MAIWFRNNLVVFAEPGCPGPRCWETSMQLKTLVLATIAMAAFVAPALAHHSFAMFDATKNVTLDGTVKEFEWTNPHSWIRITVADNAGTPREWAIEMNSPAQNAQRGWKSDTLRAGDKVTLVIHPLRDGSRGGQFMSAKLADGKVFSNDPNFRYDSTGARNGAE